MSRRNGNSHPKIINKKISCPICAKRKRSRNGDQNRKNCVGKIEIIINIDRRETEMKEVFCPECRSKIKYRCFFAEKDKIKIEVFH